MQVDPEDPPTRGNDGRLFIVLMNEDLGGFLKALELAGLNGDDLFIRQFPAFLTNDNDAMPEKR